MPRVDVQDVGVVDFPDDATDQEIQDVLNDLFPAKAQQQAEPPVLDPAAVAEQFAREEQERQNMSAYMGGSLMSPGGPEMDFARALYSPVFGATAKIGEGLNAVMEPIGRLGAPVLSHFRQAAGVANPMAPGIVPPELKPGESYIQGLEPPAEARGIIPSLRRAAAGLTTPESIMVAPFAMGSGGVARAIQGAFAVGAGAAIPGAIQELAQAETPAETRGAATDIALNALFAGIMGRQALKPNTRAETISMLRRTLESEPQLPIPTERVAPALRQLGIPQETLGAEPFLQPGVRKLVSDVLAEAQGPRIEIPGQLPALETLRRELEPPRIEAGEPTRFAERVEGGGEAPYGKVTYRRPAEEIAIGKSVAASSLDPITAVERQPIGEMQGPPRPSQPLKSVVDRIREQLERRDLVAAVDLLSKQPANVQVKSINEAIGVGRKKVTLSAAERTIFNELWDKAYNESLGKPASGIKEALTAIDIGKLSPYQFVEYVKGKDQLAEQQRIAQAESTETLRAITAQSLDEVETARKAVDMAKPETLQAYASAAAKMQFFNEALREKSSLTKKGVETSEKAQGQEEVLEPKPTDIISKLESLKLPEIGEEGRLYSLPHPDAIKAIGVSTWNSAVDVAIASVKAGKAIAEAVDEAIKYLKTQGKKFDEAQARRNFEYQIKGETETSAAKPVAEPTLPPVAERTVTDPITGDPAKLITEKAAKAMELKVKIPAQKDVAKLTEQIDLFNKEIGDALETGGQFLPKELRPDVAKGAPAERGTVTNKDINQYFINKLSSIRKQMQAAKNRIAQQADVESQVYFDTLQKRFETAFRQVQELRRASHEALYFWNKIRAEYQDIARAAGEMPEMKRQLPILDQIWKDFRDGKPLEGGKHLVDYLRMNLFTMGSWTLDFGTNLVASATKLPAWAIMDIGSLVTGNSPTRMFSAMRALQNGMRNWNPLGKRYRLPEAIESELGTTAGGEFGGKGREVMVDFSEILRDRPELADKLRHVDKVIGAPIRMKRAVDSFFGRFGAAAELYNSAYKDGLSRGLKGDELKTHVEEYVQNPSEQATSKAIQTGKELKFNRDLTRWEEAFASNTVTKLVVEAFPRWTLQFIRWGGEMIGVDPSFFKKIVTGKATPEDAVHYLTKAATGWGGIYTFNQLFYDNIDANSMEYVKEDGNRVRLAGRTPAPELFFIVSLLRGDTEKAKAALQHLSVPGAKLLSGEPAGVLSPLVDTFRQSISGRYTAEQTARELTKLVNDAIPGKSVLGLIRSIYDPTVREGIGAPIPGVASLLPQPVNPTTGEPLAPKTRIPGTSIQLPTVGGTPFPGAERVLNDVESALLDHGLGLTRPRRTSIIDLPAEDVPKEIRREYEKLVGQNVRDFIGAEIKEPDFKDLPFEVRREVLQELLSASRELAKADLAEKYGAEGSAVQSTPLNIKRLPERLRK